MKVSSQAMIAGALLLAGVGAFVVAGLGAEADVVQVEDLLGAAPPQGTRTLVGVPQPAELPVQGAAGVTLVPNPAYPGATTHAVAWSEAGSPRHSVLRLEAVQQDGAARFTLTNETRVPGQAEPLARTQASFEVPGLAVPVRAFEDGDGHSPVVWAVLPPSHLKEPLRDVPSQLRGALLQGAPEGAVVWVADSFKAGCSSKFLPEEEKDIQAARA